MSSSVNVSSDVNNNASSPNLVSNSGSDSKTPFQRQSSSGTYTAPVQVLTDYLKYMLGINKPNPITKRSLSEEAECGSPESLSEWLRQGSDPNEIDAYGYTPLINASLRGCCKSVKILLSNGAEINKKAMHGYCALHAASQNGHIELVELLIDQGADMNIQNDDGDTALMLAVRSDNLAIVDALCKRGCNIHIYGFENQDPIQYAMDKRNLKISELLIRHDRQHLNSTSSSIEQNAQNTSFNSHSSPTQINNKLNISKSEDLKSSPSLTTLMHQQQEEHQNAHSISPHNDSVFFSD